MVKKKQFQNLTKKEFTNLLFNDFKGNYEEIGGITRGAIPFFLFYLKNNFYKKIAFISSDEEELYQIYEEVLVFDDLKEEIFIKEPVENDDLSLRNFINSIKLIDEKEKAILFLTEETLNKNLILEKDFELIKKGDIFPFNKFIKEFLNQYNRVNYVQNYEEFSVRGGIIDFYPYYSEFPIRIVFDGDRIEDIREFDIYTQKSIKFLDEIKIKKYVEGKTVLEHLKNDYKFISYNKDLNFSPFIKICFERTSQFNFDFTSISTFYNLNKTLELKEDLEKNGFKVLYIGFDEEIENRIDGLIKENFISLSKKIAVIGKKRKPSFPIKRVSISNVEEIESIKELNKGDIVVHIDFGIGRYEGIKTLERDGILKDYILIEYDKGEKLYVPIEKIERIKKYIGDIENISLSRLGGTEWTKSKEKAREDIQKFARELLSLYAKREVLKKVPYKEFKELEDEFANSFEYDLTLDQEKAIKELLSDLSSEKITERIICGDTGFGKTEVALRGALRVILNGKQVLLLTPTTILAMQHLRVIKERFKNLPIRVEMLSRLLSEKEEREILKDLENGKIDFLIGTHRVLSDDVKFFDLGFLIIDEEHLFGVEHKEKIKKLKEDIDTIYLSATPIPRTLEMALSGIKDMSIIRTPPIGRYPVETKTLPFDPYEIKRAIEKELQRGGQIYYVHNKIYTIENEKNFLLSLIPKLKILVLHGRLDSKEIEDGMIKFINKEYDLLLSTTIIEAGLDNENVNTIIVVDSQNFGLSQLYQLKGRVGRRDKKAFAYLFYDPKKTTELGKKRLKVLESFSFLGAGFQVALKDLEIRGAGNLLGKEQSGHINALGFDLYFELVEEEVSKIKGKEYESKIYSELEINVDNSIPSSYIKDENTRFYYYKKFFEAENFDEIEKIKEEIEDRFGKINENLKNLIETSKLNILMKKFKIKKISNFNNEIYIKPSQKTPIDSIKIKTLEKIFLNRIKFTPSEIVILDVKDPIQDINRFFNVIKI
ncbi:MAG: transcription-repair coupling factor [Caldisericia bacterium]|nr:transcription-repair coupling factor [Caldisericia bacterium]